MSKKEIAELRDQCKALGWKVTPTAGGFYTILPPSGDTIITPSSATGRALANFKADLRRAGFSTEAIQAAKATKAAHALAVDRQKNEAVLAKAVERAARRNEAAALAPVALTLPKNSPTLANPFVPVAAPAQNFEVGQMRELAGYPRKAVRVTQKEADRVLADSKEAQEHGGCRQRHLYPANSAKFRQAMELGEWGLNPADSLVFCAEHKSIVNGQHRIKALRDADTEFVETFYPEGVPFYITTGFPCAMSHIFDTGKARSVADALTVEGLEGWSKLAASSLRLALQYDQSFAEGGEKDWTKWRNLTFTNTEMVEAAASSYARLLDNSRTVSRAYTRSNLTRSAAMVATFLIERDNPEGVNQQNGHSTALFWKGVCGDDDMKAGDPRMALVRVAVRAKTRSDSGPTMLAHILKQYANYMIGTKKVDLSVINRELPMLPVWRPGMKFMGQELRLPR